MRHSALLAALVLGLVVSVRPATGQPAQVSVLLQPGWNNVGYVGPTRLIPVALAHVAGRYESVWTWDAAGQRWLGMNPYFAAAGDFVELRQNQAYWIRMSAPGVMSMEIPPVQPPAVLGPGWNNFVYPGPEQFILDALAHAAGRFDSVWHWDSARQQWNGFTPTAPLVSDLTTLAPGRPYFVKLVSGPPVVMAPPAPPPAATPPSLPVPPVPAVAVPQMPGAISPAQLTPVAPAAVAVPSSAAPAVPVPAPATVTPAPTMPASALVPATTTPATPTPAPAPRSRGCYPFQSYQPQFPEVATALTRAGFAKLSNDQDFRIKEIETSTDGSGGAVPPYIPPTLLKAIGWIESTWRQATYQTPRGATGPTITSTSCAYGLMQLLSEMTIDGTPTARQQKIGTDYVSNIAAGAQMLAGKWNLAPEYLPVVLPRNPRALEDWYYAVWAYHCYGTLCDAYNVHNNPEDPALKWPRPVYNSPEQLTSGGQFSFTDYPYQELVYGVIIHPPTVDGRPARTAQPVKLPPRGAVGFPDAKPFSAPGATFDPTPDGGEGTAVGGRPSQDQP